MEKSMTWFLHMSGTIMHAGLTARIVVQELGGLIPGLWQSPFHFTDDIWLWWSSDGVILTPTKRGLSQPPEALWRGCNCREGVCEQERGWLLRGFIDWKIWVDGSNIFKVGMLKKCWGRENDAERERTRLSAQGLLSILVTGEASCEHST